MAESSGSSAQSVSGPAGFPTASSSGLGADSNMDVPPDTLRIVLVGKTGCGKSSTGNTILGREEFVAKTKGKSVTQVCSKATTDVDGRQVALVDTPGLSDTRLPNHVVIKETFKSISLLAPGPHAILLLVRIGRFTKEERDAVEYIKAAFGKDADKYIMILFTHGDSLEGTIEEYFNEDEALESLIADCGERFHVFNNKEKENRTQVEELLRKINVMVKNNGGSHYTSEMLREAEKAIQEKMEKIMKEKDEEIKREMERINRKHQEEIDMRDEEKKQMEKALQEKDETIKEERELREKEQKEREERERETEQQMKKQRLRDKSTEIYKGETGQTELMHAFALNEQQRLINENMEIQQRGREQQERQDLAQRCLQEIERRHEEDVDNLKKKYEAEARTKAEQNNSFLDKVMKAIEAVQNAADKVADVVNMAGSVVVQSVCAAFKWFRR